MSRKQLNATFGLLIVISLFLGIYFCQNALNIDRDACCGPSSVYGLLHFLGDPVKFQEVENRFPAGGRVVSLENIVNCINETNYSAHGFQMTIAELKKDKPLGILHIGGNHFVALVGYGSNGILILNPSRCETLFSEGWTYDTLSGIWDGKIAVVHRKKQQNYLNRNHQDIILSIPTVRFKENRQSKCAKKSVSLGLHA